jgi:transposase
MYNHIKKGKIVHMSDYPSEITREQFELIKAELESARKTTKPRKLDLFDVFNALLYVLTGGIQWRMLPKDYPKWQSVYFYFQIWSEKAERKESILESVLKKLSRWSEIAMNEKIKQHLSL